MNIEYIDRSQGKVCQEKVYGLSSLLFLYGKKSPWKKLLSLCLLPLFTYFSAFSRLYGWLQKKKGSKKKIAPFLAEYEIDASEFVKKIEEFESFNDFFIRQLKAEARPIEDAPLQAVLPADGRYLVFPKVKDADGFYVKGKRFCLESFLASKVLARRFSEGSMVIARLCPTDCHRFFFPFDAVAGRTERIGGHFFSVSPIALKVRPSILWENKRFLTELESPLFGTVLYVEVGATCVASVKQTYESGVIVKKGEEKGYFEFGGSTLVLLFEKGKITFAEDLLANSSKGIETRGLLGQSLGTAL